VARAEAYLHAKFHLDPSNRLATIHQRHRQDRTGQTDRQLSDSIGQTVLQTVAQKCRQTTVYVTVNITFKLLVEDRNAMVNDVPDIVESVEYAESGVLLPNKLEKRRSTRR